MTKKKEKQDTKSFDLKPLGDRVLVKEQKTEIEKTDSGIFLATPISEDQGAKRGKVVAVGEGKILDDGKRMPMGVKKGDDILFQWGDEIKIDGVAYYIVSESNILGIID